MMERAMAINKNGTDTDKYYGGNHAKNFNGVSPEKLEEIYKYASENGYSRAAVANWSDVPKPAPEEV